MILQKNCEAILMIVILNSRFVIRPEKFCLQNFSGGMIGLDN